MRLARTGAVAPPVAQPQLVGGELRISVPVGNYAVSGLFTHFAGGTFTERFAVLADVSVRQDTAATLDAATVSASN
jgi:hypothetical protein